MQQRLAFCRRAFYLGLFLTLGTGILSAAAGSSNALPVLTLIGAGIALAARIWHGHVQRAARLGDNIDDPGGYRLDLLRNPRFTLPGRLASR